MQKSLKTAIEHKFSQVRISIENVDNKNEKETFLTISNVKELHDNTEFWDHRVELDILKTAIIHFTHGFLYAKGYQNPEKLRYKNEK